MASEIESRKPPSPTFEVRFTGADVSPEMIPIRSVSNALGAIQDIATGRDPYEVSHVAPERAIGLLEIRRGSAIYECVSRAPDEAVRNLSRVGALLLATGEEIDGDELVAALRPIQSLSEVAKALKCRLEVRVFGNGQEPLFAIEEGDYQRLSKRLLLKGDTTVVGRVERVGGATGMRCLLRVPGRRKCLYCDVASKEVVRRLGQHLYENIVASGSAVWIHRSWRIYKFKINDFTQPRLGNPEKAIEHLRSAGMSAWDSVADPEGYLREHEP